MTDTTSAQDTDQVVAPRVTFLGESASYRTTLGMYKIAEDGSIVDVQLIFANASKYDSGGELIVGESSVDIDVSSTDKLGFFILPDGYRRNSDKSLFEGSNYVLRNASGELGNVYSDNGLKLFHVDETTGIETMLHARYGNSTYHMLQDLSRGINLNGDGLDHALGEARDGNKVVIGFEDIKKNGDWDFDDVVADLQLFGAVQDAINLSQLGLLASGQTKTGWLAANATQSGNDVVLNLGNGTLTLSSLGPLVDVSTELENALIL